MLIRDSAQRAAAKWALILMFSHHTIPRRSWDQWGDRMHSQTQLPALTILAPSSKGETQRAGSPKSKFRILHPNAAAPFPPRPPPAPASTSGGLILPK